MTGLSDIRVLAVEQFGAGPFGSLHLADLGADVIKIEDPVTGGDVGRQVPPFSDGADSLFFQGFNRNKRSVALDLRCPGGRRVFEDLVARADAVYCNLRGDVPGCIGLDYDSLGRINPLIVCCSLSGFGTSGSRAADPAYDIILQGMAGWMAITGEPGTPPTKSGLSLVDYCAGLVAAMSVLGGVHVARRDGRGGDCDVSMLDTAISMLTYLGTWWLTEDLAVDRVPQSGHASIVPFGCFPTADGWIVIACAKEKFWRRATEALGHPELAEDPRFADFDARRRNQDELITLLNSLLGQQSTAVWLQRMRTLGVPCGPVNSIPEALAQDEVSDRGMIVSVPHATWGNVRQLRTAVRGWWEGGEQRRAPNLGENRSALLGELLGYSFEDQAQLAASGAFGPTGPEPDRPSTPVPLPGSKPGG